MRNINILLIIKESHTLSSSSICFTFSLTKPEMKSVAENTSKSSQSDLHTNNFASLESNKIFLTTKDNLVIQQFNIIPLCSD